MIAEALKYLIEQGKAAKPDVVKVDGLPHTYFHRKADGTLEEWDVPNPDNCAAGDLDTLVRVALRRADDGSEVWYDANSVVCRYGEYSRERTTLKLEFSKQYLQLRSWETPTALDQETLIRHLRVTFRDALPAGESLVAVVRKVKFATATTIDAEQSHGKASVGKQIMGEVTGTAALPEYVTLAIPVFANPSLSWVFPVECAFEPDPRDGKFRLIPLPGQLDGASAHALDKIRQDLVAALGEIPVYHGRPN